jgi:aryl-alcohol dehydrogenase-like predicted oxidoreductase
MKYGTIGEIDRVSRIGLGGGGFGSQIAQDAVDALLDRFVGAGGNFVDSAHIYGAWDPGGSNGGCGNSEVAIGRWMAKRDARGHLIVGTKGGHPDFATGASGMTRQTVLRHLRESLEHLQTDYIDVYYFHRDDRAIPVEEILSWMAEPLAAGTIRVLACSNWRADRIAEARAVAAARGLPLIEASQISWSLAHASRALTSNKHGEQVAMDEGAWEFHRLTQLPQVAYNGQAGGLFARFDGCSEAELTAPEFVRAALVRRYDNDLTWRRRRLAQRLAKEKGCSTNHIALAWMLHQPFPAFPIVGTANPGHLADSLSALEVPLSPDETERLRLGAE